MRITRARIMGAGAAMGLLATVLGAGLATPAAAQTATGSSTNQAQQATGSGQNQAGSVTQPGVAQTNNAGREQSGNTGTGMAGGRSDTNPFPAAK